MKRKNDYITIQNLIDVLNSIEDKSKVVAKINYNGYNEPYYAPCKNITLTDSSYIIDANNLLPIIRIELN